MYTTVTLWVAQSLYAPGHIFVARNVRFGSKADIAEFVCDVRYVRIADISIPRDGHAQESRGDAIDLFARARVLAIEERFQFSLQDWVRAPLRCRFEGIHGRPVVRFGIRRRGLMARRDS